MTEEQHDDKPTSSLYEEDDCLSDADSAVRKDIVNELLSLQEHQTVPVEIAALVTTNKASGLCKLEHGTSQEEQESLDPSAPGAYHAVPRGVTGLDEELVDDSESESMTTLQNETSFVERELGIMIEAELVASPAPDAADEEALMHTGTKEIYKAEPLNHSTTSGKSPHQLLVAVGVVVLIGLVFVVGGTSFLRGDQETAAPTSVPSPKLPSSTLPPSDVILSAGPPPGTGPFGNGTSSRSVVLDVLQSYYEDGIIPESPSSPEQMALIWQLEILSPRRYGGRPAPVELLRRNRIVSRFSLVLLYLSTGGENWTVQADFLDEEKHECTWNVGSAEPFVGVVCDSQDNVVEIALANNHLRGTLPRELEMLTKLSVLRFGSDAAIDQSETTNLLEGSIPAGIWNMTSLVQLDLSGNEGLTGPIPTEVGHLSNLIELRLNDNALTGTIPDVIGRTTSLTYLNLDNNALTGNVPASLHDVPCVSLTGNELSSCSLISSQLNSTANSVSHNVSCFQYNPPCELAT